MKFTLRKSVSALTLATLAIGLTALMPTTSEAGKPSRTWNINSPGSYSLRGSVSVDQGDAIVISASNVTLDLNGFSVSTKARGTGRGIVIDSAKAVTIRNGKVSGFNANVALVSAENAKVSNFQITGDGLAPNGGPSEIGVLLIDSRACTIASNNISSVNLGIFVRGGGSTGNRIEKNVVVGGATDANNLFGICYNPAPDAGPEGPSGDSIYNNHIARFNIAVSVSAQSTSNIFTDNTLSSFSGPFQPMEAFEANGGTNVEFDNASSTLVATP
ncbi:MAG: hypothetical protein O3C21_15560 [Verrucomicrobia bacterium]|nr:hypothetical protein [Verrucomicrobiota bacterium]